MAPHCRMSAPAPIFGASPRTDISDFLIVWIRTLKCERKALLADSRMGFELDDSAVKHHIDVEIRAGGGEE